MTDNITQEFMYDRKKLTPYELDYIDNTGFWDEKNRAIREEKMHTFLDKQKNGHSCYIRRFDVYLRDFTDIALLFPNVYVVNEFIAFLFKKAIHDEVNGGWPFYYREFKGRGKDASKVIYGTYNFDYAYLLAALIDWAVDECGAMRSDMEYYMTIFSPSKKEKGKHRYARINNFLIGFLFGSKHEILPESTYRLFNMPDMKIDKRNYFLGYYTEAIVRAEDGEEYFFRSVPLQASKVLFALDKETAHDLIINRERECIKQVCFGEEQVRSRGARDNFFIINFPVRRAD